MQYLYFKSVPGKLLDCYLCPKWSRKVNKQVISSNSTQHLMYRHSFLLSLSCVQSVHCQHVSRALNQLPEYTKLLFIYNKKVSRTKLWFVAPCWELNSSTFLKRNECSDQFGKEIGAIRLHWWKRLCENKRMVKHRG